MVLHPLDPSNSDVAPFMVADGRARVGLRSVADSEWLHRDANFEAEIALKHEILASEADDSVGCLDGAELACIELLELVEAATGSRADSALRPIDAAGRMVQEDLCVLDGASLRLFAGSVCFPHGWRLVDKLGLAMSDVHVPVPHYGDLAERADRSVEALDTRIRARTNWFVVGDGAMRIEPGHVAEPPYSLHLRFERQTLRRLPNTRAVVFTIRSYVTPLADIDDRPDLQRGLLRALETMSGEERDYHGSHEPARLAAEHLHNRLGDSGS